VRSNGSLSWRPDLIKASIPVIVGGKVLSALIHSETICSKLNSTLYPSSHQVRMTSTSVKVKSLEFCIVVEGSKYASTRLNVLPTICCDIILGLDFQNQHQRVTRHFEFGGNLQDIVVSHDETCAVSVAETQEVSLFSNLTAGVKPITTKSRHFSLEDRLFIQDNVDKMLSEGVIRPSSYPWRAQVLIVKDGANVIRKDCVSIIPKQSIFIRNWTRTPYHV